MPTNPTSSGALGLYAKAAQFIAGDAGIKNAPPIKIFTSDNHPSARAVADGPDGTISVATVEAQGLQSAIDKASKTGFDKLPSDEQKDLQFRTFTALHEASHVTGPVMPPTSKDSKVDTMWEEGLASLNARRLTPTFVGSSFPDAHTKLTRIEDITYGGIAKRITELLELTGRIQDTPQFDSAVRELAESIPWRERSLWMSREIAKAKGIKTDDTKLAPLVPFVQGYVNRPNGGSGLIESTLEDIRRAVK